MVQNPLSERVRGYIYVAGVVVGFITLLANTLLEELHWDSWQPMVAAFSSGFAMLVGTLARSNTTGTLEQESIGEDVSTGDVKQPSGQIEPEDTGGEVYADGEVGDGDYDATGDAEGQIVTETETGQ